jgi:hypothetical protein
MQIGSSFSAMPATYSANRMQYAPIDALRKIAPSESDTPEKALMKFLEMTPAEKMQFLWLNAHHLTREELATMSPDERAAIQKQMTTEIQQKAREDMEKKSGQSGQSLNILA